MATVELYGAEGSGSIAVEAALTLLQLPYTLIEGATWAHESARERIAPVNAMRQVPNSPPKVTHESVHFGLRPRRGREAEVAARKGGLAAAVSFE